jgi:uncharacterized ParB-like nuclease family protein
MKPIKLTDIRIDGGTQTRAEISNATVEEYSEAVLEGAKFPPVDVFFDGVENWLADGFHRYHAHKRAGVTDIAATIHNGSKDDALVFALGANRANGLRRTNEDKRKCVGIALQRWPEWSNRRVAEVCGVSHMTVSRMRPEEVEQSATVTQRVGKDGVRQPATKPKAEIPPHPDDLPSKQQQPQQQPVPRAKIDAAERIWAVAKGHLDKILKGDVSRERVLLQVIAYCQERIKTHQ